MVCTFVLYSKTGPITEKLTKEEFISFIETLDEEEDVALFKYYG